MKHVSSFRRARRWIIAAAALILAVTTCHLVSDRAESARAAPPPSGARTAGPAVPVTMAPAAVRDVDIAVRAIGTVTPVATVTITSRVAGVLEEVHYREGQMVRKGDLLAVIDPRPYAAALAQARGQLARDQAQLANARIDLERYRNAAEQHAIPEQQAATQQALVQAGEATVKFDEASVQAAQVNLDYTHITSPIDGRVGLRMIDPGNNVIANGTAGLVTITQLKPITVVFTLAQDALPQVLAGLRLGAKLRVQAFEGASMTPAAEGELLTIDNNVDQASGTFRLKAEFANDDITLWPGEFVKLRFIVGVRPNAVTVPARSVQRGPQGSYVYVINPDLTVQLRAVDTVTTDQGLTIITSGVKAGEHVVVDGQYRLETGTKVAIQPARNSPASVASAGNSAEF
jgi:multidrug efflux system membrane fusion protein